MDLSSSEEDIPILPSQQRRLPAWAHNRSTATAPAPAWQPMFYQQPPPATSRLASMLQGFLMAIGAVFLLAVATVFVLYWVLGIAPNGATGVLNADAWRSTVDKVHVAPTERPVAGIEQPAPVEQKPPAAQEPSAPQAALRTALVAVGKLNVRKAAGPEQALVDQLYAGETVEVLEETRLADGMLWVHIRTVKDRATPVEGWVNAKYLQ